MKEDGTEVGRTRASEIVSINGDSVDLTKSDGMASTPTSGQPLPAMVSWEGESHHATPNQFAVTLSPHRGGGLPLQLTVELWETTIEGNDDDHAKSRLAPPGPNSTGDRKTTKHTSATVGKEHGVTLIGIASVGPDTLVLSLPGRLTLPLKLSPLNPRGAIRRGEGVGDGKTSGRGVLQSARGEGRAAGVVPPATGEATGSDVLPSKIVLRVTPQVGLHWGHRVMEAAAVARRVNAPPPPAASPSSTGATAPPILGSSASTSAVPKNGSSGLAHVVYMTNAEGSARTWRAPVTPGSSIPPKDYEDVLELVCGSVPACCPRAPALLVAPVSDIGVQLGQAWIGPRIAARHAIVAHRPQQLKNDSSMGSKGDDDNDTAETDGNQAPSIGGVDSTLAVEAPREDELFLRVVAAEAEDLLRELRASDMRAEQRRMALVRVREICETWTRARVKATASRHQTSSYAYSVHEERKGGLEGFSSSAETTGSGTGRDADKEAHGEVPDGDAEHNGDEAEGIEAGEEGGAEHDDHLGGRAYSDLYRGVLRALEMALPGVSMYLGLLERGGKSIRYVACTKQSSMAGKQLKKGEGISFCCVGPHYAPCVVYPPRRSGGPKRGRARNTVSQTKRPTQREKEDTTEPRVSTSADDLKHTMAEVVDTATRGTFLASARSKGPRTERSVEEIVVSIQKVFRGKKSRNQMERSQSPREPHSNKSIVPRKAHNKSNTSALLIPKVFDYEGRVGWPFVCVPLEGFLRSSSIGVLGLDTFEQMGTSGGGNDQPEAGVVQMVQEAAR